MSKLFIQSKKEKNPNLSLIYFQKYFGSGKLQQT